MLDSWNNSSKQTILNFVGAVTNDDSPNYLPVESRVAVFDNDGTLWCEKPLPIQLDFLLRRMKQMPSIDQVLTDKKFLEQVIERHYQGDDSDLHKLAGGLLKAYENSSIEEYEKNASDFFLDSQHPTLGRSYLECTYTPMIELLRFLEMNGFTNYIVSGGGRDFMRAVSSEIYHIPPERIVGSSVALEYQDKGDHADVIHKPKIDIFDDGAAKPVRIWSRIGRRPILAAGNSNGDIEMLHFCNSTDRPSLSLLINHDDSDREFSYVKGAEEALKQAEKHNWSVISMKNDWKNIFTQHQQMAA